MAKGITDATKFIRAVLTQEIENPGNQPYTVRKAANLVAFLRTAACEMLEDDWVARYGIDIPKGWRTPQGKFGDKDPSGADSQAHKKAVKYGRKFIRRDLEHSDCPFKLIIKPDANSGDDDLIIMKPTSER
tara:strand:+ start:91 stop:483 length:393 start_codon:yes stop_codon:yes gene_type:complete